jgi:hypothetical protein
LAAVARSLEARGVAPRVAPRARARTEHSMSSVCISVEKV